MPDTRMAIAIVQRMRDEHVPEYLQDGFWMGLLMAVLHPEWARQALASYEAVEAPGVASMIADCRREATRLANAIPAAPHDEEATDA